MSDESPTRRWPIWPFIPAAIVVVAIPSIGQIALRAGGLSSDKVIVSWLLAVAIAAGSLLALVYGFVRSLSDEAPHRWRRIRPYIATAVMVVTIPPFVWTGYVIEFTTHDLLDGKNIDLWQLAGAIAGGSLLALVYGMAHSLLVTMAIVGGTRILIHKRLDSIWASLLLGALLALIVLGIPPADLGWPFLMISGGAASALNWWIVVRPLRMRRLAHGSPPQLLPT
jgi:hypothetical protein